jgi:protein-S-isoprenylcysteine O-methyltransferase Ste14
MAILFAGSACFSLWRGGALRIWPIFILGRRFSGLVAIQPGHELVTSGIYGIIRPPEHLGMIILMIGRALAFDPVPA